MAASKEKIDVKKDVKPLNFSSPHHDKNKRKSSVQDVSKQTSKQTSKESSKQTSKETSKETIKETIKECLTEKCATDTITCHQCGALVDGKFVHALGKTWHPEHFECAKCRTTILGLSKQSTKFNQKDGSPYCEHCYAQLFLKRCDVCNEPIKEKVIVAMDKTYHAEHFVCTVCNEVLGDVFFEKEGKAYCETCNIKLFAPECARCNNPILETAIVALDKKWHQDCFTCAKCSKPVRDKMFQVENDKPLCSNCATVKL